MKELIVLMISAILVDNIVLSQFNGICPFLGVSKKIKNSVGMGAAVIFVMVCATLVTYPVYKALGVYLPLITTNCAVLGVTINNIDNEYTFVQSVTNALGTGLAFTLALLLFSGVRSRIEHSDIPETFKGVPATLIAASIVSISFMGFSGLFA